MKLLYNYLERHHPLSEGFKQFLESGVVQHQQYKAGTTLLAEGAVATKLCFVKKGLCRFYYYLNEQEITSLFIKEGEALLAQG